MSQVNEPHRGGGGINHTELENGETPYLCLDIYFVDLTPEMYQYPEDGLLRAETCRSEYSGVDIHKCTSQIFM